MPWVASMADSFPKARWIMAEGLLLTISLLLASSAILKAPDPTPPWVISHSPHDHEVNVPLNAPIFVNFSEPMKPSTFWIGIVPDVALSSTWVTSTNLTLDHMIPFLGNMQYVVTINGTDQSGNWLDGNHDGVGGDPLTWVFWTYSTNPYITDTWPRDGAVDVPTNSPIFVNFSGPMNPGTFTVVISPSITLSTGWNMAFDSLRLDHAAPFENCTRYMVAINSQDVIPHPWPSIPANPWYFNTTGCEPMIIDIEPPQLDASLSAPIVITFNVDMDKLSVKATLAPSVAYVMNWSSQDHILTLNHTEKFRPCATYNLTVAGNDTAGRALVVGPVPNPYEFGTVCTFPRVISHLPPGGATGVALDAPIIITFSESMDNKSVEDAFYCSDVSTTITVSDGVVSWNPDHTVFTFNTSVPFHVGRTYTVVLNSSIAHGLGDNYLDGNGNGVAEMNRSDDYSWQFTATDVTETTPPAVDNVSPGDGAINVPSDPTVVVIFSEAMNKTSVEKADTVSVWTGLQQYGLAHDFSWPNNRTVAFKLIPQLSFNTIFTLKISRTVSDLFGNQMGQDYSWSFRVSSWRGDAHGKVVDDADGAGIANATVTYQGVQTLTDSTGNFTLRDVAEGRFYLNVSKEGYDPYSSYVNVSSTTPDLGVVRLHKTTGQQTGPSPLVVFAALTVTVLLVLLALFLLSRKRQKRQPTTLEEWKGEVAVA